LFGTLVGVECEGQPAIGVVHIPGTDECVYASRGNGAWYVKGKSHPAPARVSSCRRLSRGLFLTSEVKLWWERERGDAFCRLQSAARLVRTWGDCYGYLLVATGRADLMIDPQMAVWDAAPLLTVLEEAGGSFTDWNGNATIHGGEGIGTNTHLLEEVLRLVRGE